MNDISGAIRRTNANWVMITPTVSSLLNPADVPSLKSVILCGEPVPASEIEKWKHLDFYISYGPAECSVATPPLRPPLASQYSLLQHWRRHWRQAVDRQPF